MVLSDVDIRSALDAGQIKISGFSGQLEPASYDFRVGDFAITKKEGKVCVSDTGHVVVARGETAVIYPVETIELDLCHVARFGLMSQYARRGLILLSGPQIDPGYSGLLEITVFNAGNHAIRLGHKGRFATIEFERLSSSASRKYDGPYKSRSLCEADLMDIIQTRSKSFAEYEQEMDGMRAEVSTANRLQETVIKGLVFGTSFALLFSLAKDLIGNLLSAKAGDAPSWPLKDAIVLCAVASVGFGITYSLIGKVLDGLFRRKN
jgi:deoxycytidine triphosphate deaminase